jgi:hypothetical protein
MIGTDGSESRMSMPLSWQGVLDNEFSSLPSTTSPSFFSSSTDDFVSSSPSSDLSHLHLNFSLRWVWEFMRLWEWDTKNGGDDKTKHKNKEKKRKIAKKLHETKAGKGVNCVA